MKRRARSTTNRRIFDPHRLSRQAALDPTAPCHAGLSSPCQAPNCTLPSLVVAAFAKSAASSRDLRHGRHGQRESNLPGGSICSDLHALRRDDFDNIVVLVFVLVFVHDAPASLSSSRAEIESKRFASARTGSSGKLK